MRQSCSNACYDRHYDSAARPTDGTHSYQDIWGTCDDCGGYAPDGRPCACECHKPAGDTPAAPERAMWRKTGNGAGVRHVCVNCQDEADARGWHDWSTRELETVPGVYACTGCGLSFAVVAPQPATVDPDPYVSVLGKCRACGWVGHVSLCDGDPVSDCPHCGCTSVTSATEDDERERNPEADLAEMRSEYRYEDDERYQPSEAQIAYEAEMAAETQYQREVEAAQAKYDEQWPNHCRNCGGSGRIVTRGQRYYRDGSGEPDSAEVCRNCWGHVVEARDSLGRPIYDDWYAGEHGLSVREMVAAPICPRCGKRGTLGEEGETPCSACGWTEESEGRPEY